MRGNDEKVIKQFQRFLFGIKLLVSAVQEDGHHPGFDDQPYKLFETQNETHEFDKFLVHKFERRFCFIEEIEQKFAESFSEIWEIHFLELLTIYFEKFRDQIINLF